MSDWVNADAPGLLLSGQRNGANVGEDMPDPLYENEAAAEPDMERFSISVPAEAKEDMLNIAEYWTELRKVTKMGRRRKWMLSGVCDRFIRAQLAGFWTQIGAGDLRTPKERKEFLDRLLAEEKKRAKKK